MSRLPPIEWSCQRTIGTSPVRTTGPAIVRQIGDSDTIAALFVGPLHEFAARAFEVALGNLITGDVAHLRAALAEAATAVDDYWNALGFGEQFDFGRSACGVALSITHTIAKFVWLGDVRVFHVREAAIVNCVRTHTLSNAAPAAGRTHFDARFARVLVKWLSRQHEPESTEWELRTDDAVIACSPFIESATVEQCLRETGLNGLARSIVDAAHASERRIDHTALVLTVGA